MLHRGDFSFGTGYNLFWSGINISSKQEILFYLPQIEQNVSQIQIKHKIMNDMKYEINKNPLAPKMLIIIYANLHL